MNALLLKILPALVCFSVLLSVISPVQSQSNNTIENNKTEESKTEISETIKRELSLKRPNQEADVFVISGPKQRVDKAASLGATIYIIGVNKKAVNLAIEFVLAGADPQSVGDLMLAMNGLLPKDQSADMTKFDQALESYNKIVDLADEDTLQSLENNPTFVAIGKLLQEMRKAVP
jgi:hypothetical protein